MSSSYSMDAFCQSQPQVDLEQFPLSSQNFLRTLNLPFLHPFCHEDAPPFQLEDVPPMGSASLLDGDSNSYLEACITLYYLYVPPLIAFINLWIRLLAGLLAPLGILFLVIWQGSSFEKHHHHNHHHSLQVQGSYKTRHTSLSSFQVSLIYIITVLSSLIIMTDSNYVYANGSPRYGVMMFFTSLCLTLPGCYYRKLQTTCRVIGFLCMMAIYITWDMKTSKFRFGDMPQDVPRIQDGLYYDTTNPFMQDVVNSWPSKTRMYSKETGATPWMMTGDAMTGLPFFFNQVPKAKWTRVWMTTTTVNDEEVIALDVTFPTLGHDTSKPVYLIFHGLNGGSSEGYVQDFVDRQAKAGSTVIVMISRGLMDTPLRGMSFFHTARIDDARAAAETIKRAMTTADHHQLLVGVGYSIGAGVLNNYVASAGRDCALDAAFSVSGALDARYQEHFTRSQRLWQPMIAASMRDINILPKWGKRVQSKLTPEEMKGLLRATTVTEVDKYAGAIYNGYDNVTHFYAAMSPLGDIPIEEYHTDSSFSLDANNRNVGGKIADVSIPLCVLHALDDPIVTWKAIVANEGFMHPENLVRTGKGNIMLLLTKTGGHVGWPLGWIPFRQRNWEFMNEAVSDFVAAIVQAKQT